MALSEKQKKEIEWAIETHLLNDEMAEALDGVLGEAELEEVLAEAAEVFKRNMRLVL
jgi:hypothetical protein